MTMTNELKRPKWVLTEFCAPEDVFLCAVSGGLDSMCLLHFLSTWGREHGFHVSAAHFNHQLRPAADRDEAFVRDICEKWDVPLTVGRGDVRAWAKERGLSIEEAARELRYGFLRRTARSLKGLRPAEILTAHQADDNAETVLLNLVRGTGLHGLAGIPACREGILRPFLETTRAELAEYASAHNVPYVEDETNADPAAASRNFLRQKVMPLLTELNARAVSHINQASRRIERLNGFLEQEARRRTACVKAQNGRVLLSIDALFDAPEAVRPLMLLRLFDLLGAGRKDIGSAHLEAIMKMVPHTEHSRESRLSLPHGVTARYCRRQLILETRPQPLTEVQLIAGQPLRWGDYTLTLLDHREGEGIALRDRTSSESWAVFVGPCVPGDRLTLPGARGGRSVKRLCLDRRISLEERDRLPAVYTQGRLAAVWRLGTDIEFLPEGDAVRFIQIINHREADGYEKRDGTGYPQGPGYGGGAKGQSGGNGRGPV